MRQLAQKATQGFAFTLMQSVATRAIAFVSQMLLAKLLAPAAFGEIGLLLTINAVIQPLMDFGIEDVLISRRKSFHLWAVPAYGLSISLSVLAALFLAGAAVGTYAFSRDTHVLYLLLLLSLGAFFYGFSIIPDAKLRSEMRFKITCIYGLAETVGLQGVTLILAWLGFGSASFILPIPIASAVRSIVLFRLAPIPFAGSFRLRRWSYLLRRGVLVFGQRSSQFIREQGDYMLLGLLADTTTVGLYYMSYRLAAQPVYLLVRSLSAVLFPALSSLTGHAELQVRVALRSSLILGLVITPVSFLLSVISTPMIALLFGSRWSAAVPYIQVLSIGLSFDILPAVAWSLSAARGMFRFQFVAGILTTLSFILCIGGGFALAGGVGVAYGISFNFVLSSILYSFFVFDPLPHRILSLAQVWLGPAFLSAAAMESSWFMARTCLPDHPLGQIALTSIAGGAMYAGLVWFVMREVVREAVAQISSVIPLKFQRLRRLSHRDCVHQSGITLRGHAYRGAARKSCSR